MTQQLTTKRHLLAVLLEDYYHVGAFDYLIQRGQWTRFEARFEHNTLEALDLLDRFQAKVTFFSLGWIAERQPEIIREITQRGHEIALYSNLDLNRTSPAEFKEEVLRARESLEEASGNRVLGFRAAQRWQLKNIQWALETLARKGLPTMPVLPQRLKCYGHILSDALRISFNLETNNSGNFRSRPGNYQAF